MRPEPSFARSLVAWGNACLRGHLPLAALDTFRSGMTHVRTTSFVDGARTSPPSTWLGEMQRGGIRQLLLDAGDTAGFESIVAVADAPHSSWSQKWVRIEGAKVAPWFDAVLTRQPPPAAMPNRGRPVKDVLEDLLVAARGLAALGERADLSGWGAHFARVVAVAEGSMTDGPTPLPPCAPEAAHWLARAASLADVFGGMGSWNDFGPLDDATLEDERSRLSDGVYRAVHDALVATAHA